MEIAIVQALVMGVLALVPNVPAGVAGFVQQIVAQLPKLIAAGTDLVAFIEAQLAAVKGMIAENRDPTQAEWDALNGVVASELAKLDAAAADPAAPAA